MRGGGERRGGSGRGEGQSGDGEGIDGSANRCMKSRESEDLGWGGEPRGESMDYQESLTSISTATTKLQGLTNRETDRQTDTHTLFPPCLTLA